MITHLKEKTHFNDGHKPKKQKVSSATHSLGSLKKPAINPQTEQFGPVTKVESQTPDDSNLFVKFEPVDDDEIPETRVTDVKVEYSPVSIKTEPVDQVSIKTEPVDQDSQTGLSNTQLNHNDQCNYSELDPVKQEAL